MKKINAYYTQQQIDQLEALYRKTGIKVSEHLRRAVDEYLASIEKEKRSDREKGNIDV